MGSWFRRGWIAVLLGLGTVLLYAQTTGFDFVTIDDPLYVTTNPHVRAGLSADALAWAFQVGYGGMWAPLTWISYLVDVEIWGLGPAGFHRTNVALHALNVALLFLALAALGRFLEERGEVRDARLGAAAIAALFAVHPLRVGSVAWIAERKGLLSATFLLLCVGAYVLYVRTRRRSTYLAALALFACALAAKPIAIALPGLLLLLDAWPLERLRRDGRWAASAWLEKIPFFLLSAAGIAVAFVAQQRGGAVSPLVRWGVADRLATAAVGSVASLFQAFWPTRLAVIYPLPPEGWPLATALGAAAVLATITAVAVASIRTRPWLCVGWGWYLVALAPASGLVQIGLHAWADRHSYLPHLGLYLMLTLLVAEWTKHMRRVFPFAGLVLLLTVLAAVSVHNLRFWRAAIPLFEHAAAVRSGNYFAHYSLAVEYERVGRLEEAVRHGEEAVRLYPGYAKAEDQLGASLSRLGRTDEALAHLTRAIALAPELAWAHFDLGSALLRAERPAEALDPLQRALALDPELAEGWVNLGGALERLGRTDEAIDALVRAVSLRPDLVDARVALGFMLAARGRLAEARVQLEEAVALGADDARIARLRARLEPGS